MPQVPYNPVPSAQPAGGGTPTIGVNAPGAAFGTNIGEAIQGLGKTVEQAGGELFSRAIALQQLKNETEAREADTDYMIKVGKLHAEYSALQGKDAVDAYDTYAKNIQALRQQIRGGLTNPEAQRMFDSNSLSTMGRTIFNGAGHAATQQKQWAIGEATAQMDVDAKTVSDNPKDDVLFQDKLNRTRENASNTAAMKGYGPGSAQERDLQLKATSQLWLQRITGLSRVAPFEASKYLDAHRTELSEPDFLKADNIVRSQARAVESVNLANNIFEGSLDDEGKPTRSLDDMEKDARAQSRKANPNDPVLEQHTVASLRGRYNQYTYAKRQFDQDNLETVNSAIASGVKNEQELRADPRVAAAIDSLPANKRLAIPGQINRYNAARDKVSNQENYFRVMGMAETAPKEFLDLDPTAQNLSQADQRRVYALQIAKRKNMETDPRVTHALGVLRPTLQAANIDPHKDFAFTGALADALTEFKINTGKEPVAKDIQAIGARLMQEQADPTKWTFGGLLNRTTKMYELTPPDDLIDQVKADPRWKQLGITPTDDMIRREFVRARYQELYGGTAKAKEPEKPGAPKPDAAPTWDTTE